MVLLTSVAGFAIACHGLFQDTYNYSTIELTIRYLFDAALGQHDFTIFDSQNIQQSTTFSVGNFSLTNSTSVTNDYPLHYVGVILYFVYITFTMVVLINLVIARMAVSNIRNAIM